VGYGFIVQNPNTALAMQQLSYQVGAYDAVGNVLTTGSHFVELLLPGQRLGVGGDLFVPDGTVAARVDVQLLQGTYIAAGPAQPFATERVTFVPDAYFPKVTGVVRSPYQQAITNLRLGALTYNASGKIIGGGYTYLPFVPAGGQAAAEVSVVTAGTPARSELYAAVTILSEAH
jgi:hypothetical protein